MHRLCAVLVVVAAVEANLLAQQDHLQPMVEQEDSLKLKRHLSPSYDVEQDVGNFRALMDIGKRQVSVADDVGRHYEMYNRLFAAGKKRSVVSPAHDIQATWQLSDFLERAGRK